MIWTWNDNTLATYVSTNHDICGKRKQVQYNDVQCNNNDIDGQCKDEIMGQAQISAVLAVVVQHDGTANCTSILEITPTEIFSNVNITCVGNDGQNPKSMHHIFHARLPPGIL